MAKFSGEALDWLNKLETTKQLRKENPKLSGLQLADKLGCSTAHASYISTLSDCLDQAAIDKIRQAAQGNFLPSANNALGQSNPVAQLDASQQMPFILSFNSARALAGLAKAKTTDLPGLVHSALDVILPRRLTTVQIEALVEWILKGNSPETFDPPEPGKKGKSYKGTKKDKGQKTAEDGSPNGSGPNDLQKIDELLDKVKEEIIRGDGQTTYQDELKSLLKKRIVVTETDGDSDKKNKKKSKSASKNNPWFWKWVLGAKFIRQMRSKAKKGELTKTEKLLVLAYEFLLKPLGSLLKPIGKLFKKAFGGLWHSVKKAFGKGFAKVMEWAILLLIICALIWGAGKVYQYAIVNPLHWLESKARSGLHWGGSKTDNPLESSSPQTGSFPLPAQNISTQPVQDSYPKPASRIQTFTPSTKSSYQPSTSFNTAASPMNPSGTLYDPKLLEIEIASVPDNSRLADFPLAPDEGIPADVATGRLQDLTDPDKYTMKIGQGAEKMVSVFPSNTTLRIVYKSADALGGFLDSGGQMNFFWEDVKVIHIDEIDIEGQTPSVLYQCSLIVSGAKNPLTIQCASSDDLKHLVSTMEYFIRSSRLAHDTALAGMPYPTQGLRLNDQCVVDKLWTNSPADKAGLQLGDVVWSLGKNGSHQQSRAEIEAGLAASSPSIFVVSAADWAKALKAKNSGQSPTFSPKLRKVVLAAF
ncbi:MAG TPA: hypothetical protein VN963_07685 [bacterium]|nr:hypothetical protein [bacterium]